MKITKRQLKDIIREEIQRLNESSNNSKLINKVEEIALDPDFLEKFAQVLDKNPNLQKQIETAATKLGVKIPSGNKPLPTVSEQGLGSRVLDNMIGNTADVIRSITSDQEVGENTDRIHRIDMRRNNLNEKSESGVLKMLFGAVGIPIAIVTAVKQAAIATGVPKWFVNLGQVRMNNQASLDAIPSWFWDSELGQSMMIDIYNLPNSVNIDNFHNVFTGPGDLMAVIGIFIAVVALIALRNQSKRQNIENKYSNMKESTFKDYGKYPELSKGRVRRRSH